MTSQTCRAPFCDRPAYARDHCSRHYKQLLRHGELQPDHAPADCAVEDCHRRAVTRGWCHGHYLRVLRTGELRAQRTLARPLGGATCSVEGCTEPQHARTWCSTHYQRWRTTGSLQSEVTVRRLSGQGHLTHGYFKVPVPLELRHLTGGSTELTEHRLVMAVHLNRPLAPDEAVHHRNGDRTDNRLENLELWSVMQPSGQRVTDKVAYAMELLARYEPEALARDNTSVAHIQ